MSLSRCSFTSTESSSCREPLLLESTLHDVNFSKLELSKRLTEESPLQNSNNASTSGIFSHKQIGMLKENDNENSSPINIKQPTNGCLQTSSDTTMKETSRCSLTDSHTNTNEEVDEQIRDDDESVIPVEEDEDEDDIEEISTLDCLAVETPTENMFLHLQPKKATVEKEQSVFEDTKVDHERAEVMVDKVSQFGQDECKLFQHPFMEVGRRLWPSTPEKQRYTKGCLWSPDGTCLLVPVHLDGMHIVELPADLYTLQETSTLRKLSELTSAVHVKEGGTVYDCCWFPYMNSLDPATCCWLATRQHEPIHMWDAFNGELRCSYRGYDEVDEVECAISIIFSNDGQHVIGGYKKTIKIFDTNIPGRKCSSIPIKQAVSCFALTEDNDNCVTAGTWMGYINHYDLRAPKLGPLFTLSGHSGGITWLKYAPTQDKNWYLFSGARKDNKILQWDMRNFTEPLQVFERNVKTNQRIYFDLTPLKTWLASGDTDGLLRLWNLSNVDQQFELPLHQDCCNGVSFHPFLPVISTTSGQYHFVDLTDPETDVKHEKIVIYENSLMLMWYGQSKECEDL